MIIVHTHPPSCSLPLLSPFPSFFSSSSLSSSPSVSTFSSSSYSSFSLFHFRLILNFKNWFIFNLILLYLYVSYCILSKLIYKTMHIPKFSFSIINPINLFLLPLLGMFPPPLLIVLIFVYGLSVYCFFL